MNKLDISDWQEFRISELFITEPSKNKLQVPTGASIARKDLVDGDIPRITVTNFNNGIVGYYKNIDSDNYRVFENFISVSFLGTIFYHPYKASLDMKVHCLKLKNKDLNKDIALFSYYDAPELYEAIYSGDQDYFEELYEDFLKSDKPRKMMNARSIVKNALTESPPIKKFA